MEIITYGPGGEAMETVCLVRVSEPVRKKSHIKRIGFFDWQEGFDAQGVRYEIRDNGTWYKPRHAGKMV